MPPSKGAWHNLSPKKTKMSILMAWHGFVGCSGRYFILHSRHPSLPSSFSASGSTSSLTISFQFSSHPVFPSTEPAPREQPKMLSGLSRETLIGRRLNFIPQDGGIHTALSVGLVQFKLTPMPSKRSVHCVFVQCNKQNATEEQRWSGRDLPCPPASRRPPR
jgi:hypothetical protein